MNGRTEVTGRRGRRP